MNNCILTISIGSITLAIDFLVVVYIVDYVHRHCVFPKNKRLSLFSKFSLYREFVVASPKTLYVRKIYYALFWLLNEKIISKINRPLGGSRYLVSMSH